MTAALRAWGPAVAWAAVIFAASSRPSVGVDLGSGLDKVAHFAAFAVLGLALGRGREASGWPWAAALALGLLYAATDELHQALVPGRVPDAADWVADALGTAAGLFCFHRWRRRRPGRSPARARAATNSSPS